MELKIGERCFIAENAAIIGDVVIGNDCSIWYGAVLRGDVNPIRIGDRVNIQDGAVLHTLYKRSVVEVGNDVSVGHNAIIHGAKVGSNVLVGMGAILMDNAVVPDNTIIAAGAVVLSNAELEPGVYAGVPAKKVKEGSEEIGKAAHKNAQGYMMYKEWYSEDEK
ncbi:Protein YrdA [bioreactor metagenome]|uniref:Protein YrdA n=1 Tax=bioreactor metagenome TaxID=1076179 RepID=A0A645ERC5_9ZZZZ